MTVYCLDVRANGEFGVFFVRITDHVVLSCVTTFGDVGYHWTHPGDPARFLFKIGKDYVLNKLWGAQLRQFDGEGTIKSIRRSILQDRRSGDISKEEAAHFWGELNLCDRDPSLTEWTMGPMSDGDFHTRFWESSVYINNPQAEGFWSDLWPAFLTALEEKMQHDARNREAQRGSGSAPG